MAQVQQKTNGEDPITEKFIVDRQVFWNRFTGFTTNAVIAVVILLVLLWFFIV